MFLVPGSGNRPLGLKIAENLPCEVIDYETRRFPDGERYIRFTRDVPRDTALVTQSLYKDPDDLLIEYTFLAKTLLSLGAKNIVGVFPYMAYLRQDNRFKPGEAISANIISQIIESAPTSAVVTMDSHLHRIHDLSGLFQVPAVNLSAIPSLAECLKSECNLQNPVVVAPDEEAKQWANLAAPVLEAESVIMQKVRRGDTSVDIDLGHVKPHGRDIVLVDDIISTGGTIAQAAQQLKSKGANHVHALVTHGLFVEGAFDRVSKAGVEHLITSDTVPNQFSKVTVAPVFAKALNEGPVT
ncbi:MAG: ribose-phosphate diphosphokinase [Conexivisphaerales archaeon]|jgi:ribose-phosphate pyrophosphokinase